MPEVEHCALEGTLPAQECALCATNGAVLSQRAPCLEDDVMEVDGAGRRAAAVERVAVPPGVAARVKPQVPALLRRQAHLPDAAPGSGFQRQAGSRFSCLLPPPSLRACDARWRAGAKVVPLTATTGAQHTGMAGPQENDNVVCCHQVVQTGGSARLEHVGEQEHEAGVHARAQADGGQDAQAHPPDDVPQPHLRARHLLRLLPCAHTPARPQASCQHPLHF